MSARGDVTLRRAAPDDLDAVAALFLACWRQSYRGVLPDRLVELFDPVSARDLWRRSMASATTDREVIVAERADGTIVGVVTVGEDPDSPGTGHVFSLYVGPEAQERGIGTRLLSAAVDRLASRGFTRASLWVFEANGRARAFYERMGWRADGTSRVEPEFAEPESRLTRSLVSRAGPCPG